MNSSPLKMMAASMSHHSWQSRESVGVQTDAVPTAVDEVVALGKVKVPTQEEEGGSGRWLRG